MSITVIELPTQDLRDARILRRRDHQIFDHYLRYLELLDEWPALTLAAAGGRLVVSRGGEVLDAARILGRERVRAVVTDENADVLRRLVGSPAVRRLDWAAIESQERAATWIDDWHVLFFADVLGAAEKALFAGRVEAFFREVKERHDDTPDSPVLRLEFSDSDGSVRYLVRLPANDDRWYGAFLTTLWEFSREHSRILSFQGTEFTDPA